MDRDSGYVVIWEFRVKPGMEFAFEKDYGSEGVWARFFATGTGFIRTELTRDSSASRRYITLDFWVSQEAYEKFREKNAEQYHTIDAQCEAMTESEVEIGRFARAGNPGEP
jgi:heme-degrading monooxygenase HmoA